MSYNKNMQDFKLEYTEPDKVYETVETKPQEPQYRYYEIEVSRRQTAFVNVRVPHNVELTHRNALGIAEKAVADLIREYDWEVDFPMDIDVEHFKEVTESEATAYDVYEHN